jgi:hypothetical protein
MCFGSGLIHTYASPGASGDVYCVDGMKRFCLGNQMYSWRDIGSSTWQQASPSLKATLGGLVTAEREIRV